MVGCVGLESPTILTKFLLVPTKSCNEYTYINIIINSVFGHCFGIKKWSFFFLFLCVATVMVVKRLASCLHLYYLNHCTFVSNSFC